MTNFERELSVLANTSIELAKIVSNLESEIPNTIDRARVLTGIRKAQAVLCKMRFEMYDMVQAALSSEEIYQNRIDSNSQETENELHLFYKK
jgi:hypothetical protein